MAPLPEIADTYRVTFEWGPLVAVNVMHFHDSTAGTPAVISKIMDNWTAAMTVVVANTQRIHHISATPLDGSGATYTVATDSNAKWQGGGSGDPIPQVAAVVKHTTVFRGRSARGRTFLGPLSENIVTAGMLGSTFPTSLATAWTAFQTAMVADDCPQVVASYKNQTAATILAYNIRLAAGTMRLRQSRLAG